MTQDSRLKLSLFTAVLLAAAVRAPALVAAWPYSHYVDEGHVMLNVMRLVRDGGWDPGWYIYPSLPLYAIALPARLLAPLYGWLRGETLAGAVPPLRVYELLEPPELLLLGRLLTLIASLAIVVLAGLLARRLAGDLAGGLAALAAALVPALVVRGGIVIVDTWAALFVLACLLLTDRLVTSPHPTAAAAALAGAMGGLALASKYTGGLVGIAFGVAVLLAPIAWRRKLLLLTAGGAGAVLAAIAAMPALVLRPQGVRDAWQWLGIWYGGSQQASMRFWPQAVRHAEWDQPLPAPELGWPFLLLAAAGLAVALADRLLARRIVGWVIYGAVFVGLAARFPFQPFRNLLPLVAPAAVLAALTLAWLVRRLPGPRWAWGAAAALALVLVLGRPALLYAQGRWEAQDSRTEALAWLAPRLRPDDRVLVSQELAILPSELRRLPARVRVAPWPAVREALRSGRYRFYLGGALRLDGRRPPGPRSRERVARRYEVRAVFGDGITYAHPGLFSGNRRRVDVWEVRPSGRQGASGLRRDEGRVR